LFICEESIGENKLVDQSIN